MHVSRNAPMPGDPSASKKASCGFTATACGATASTIPQQKRVTSPRSSTGSRSGWGSRPTTSWLRFRSTSAASRSPKVCVATTIAGQLTDRQRRRAACAALPAKLSTSPAPSTLERRLQLAAGAELRNGAGCDLDALARPRIDAHTGSAVRRGELAEAREVDGIAGLQRVGDRLHERVDGLPRVAVREAALSRDLLDELLLRQSLPPGLGCRSSDLGEEANKAAGYRSTMRRRNPSNEGCERQGTEAHRGAGERIRAALLPVDHADRCGDREAGIAKSLDSLEGRAACGHHVLDEADDLAGLERTLDPVAGAVRLRLVAHDHERE